MSKKFVILKEDYPVILDLGSLFLAVIFLVTVIIKAAELGGYLPGSASDTAPFAYALIFGLIIIFFNWYQSKGKLSALALVALTILLTSSAIWLLGLHGVWPVSGKI